MKKILKLLEAYVQWATLVLGAAFLGFMVWTYIIQNPASKTMTANNETVTVSPGTVDPTIKNGVVQTLIQKMSPTTPLSISAPALASLPWGPPATQPSVKIAANSWPQDIPSLQKDMGTSPITSLIQNLPALPPLEYLDNEELRTVVQVNAPNGGAPGKKDQDSVTTFWTLPVAALAKAYDDAFAGKLGLEDQKVVFAHADIIRQQQMPDGSWGPDTPVASVPIAGQPPYPDKASPAYKDQATTYEAWLVTDKNQKSIVNTDYPPVFFAPVDRPDLQWKTLEALYAERAGQPAGAAAPNPQAAGPAAAPAAGFNPLDPDATPPAQAPAGGGPAQPAAPGRAGGRRGAPGNGIFGNPVIGGLGQQVAGAQAPAVPAAPLAQVPAPVPVAPAKLPTLQQVPDAGFNADAIAKQPGDLELYFHDMTVEPGATYRYKVVYSVINPVFGRLKAVKNPADAQSFVIDSPVSGWSQPIAVPQRTRFWCSNKQPTQQLRSSGRVDFTVFVWHDGKWNKKEYPGVATGDEIGDGEFVSHVTLLGAAAPPGTEQPRQILLVPDTGGPAELRNERSDASSPELQFFMKTYAAQMPPSDAAPAPAGGPAQPPTGLQPQPTGPGQLAPGA